MKLRLTPRQIEIFSAVATHLSYTQAAKKLHLTQPAVSMQVRQLEDLIGMPLFERLGRRIALTEAGQELLAYARRVSQLLEEAGDVLEGLQGGVRGHLALSVVTTANHFTTRLLAAFTAEYPDITFSLDVTNRRTLLDQLASHAADLIIMGQPPESPGLAGEAFLENPLVVVASADHPLLKRRGPLTPEELRGQTFVVREQGSGTRTAMERFFAEHGISLETPMEFTSNEAIKHAVEAGLGLGLVSRHTLRNELELGVLKILPVEGMPLKRSWYLVRRADRPLSRVAASFREFVLKYADEVACQADPASNTRKRSSKAETKSTGTSAASSAKRKKAAAAEPVSV
jgi:DNA-binding transcriptional LysR family regulator